MDSGLLTNSVLLNEAMTIIHDQARACEEHWQRTAQVVVNSSSVRKRLELDFSECASPLSRPTVPDSCPSASLFSSQTPLQQRKSVDCTPRLVTPHARKMQLHGLRSATAIEEELLANNISHNVNPYTADGQLSPAAATRNQRPIDERFLNQMRFSLEFDSGTCHLLAEGSFGVVLAAQNRLDGVWYVIKTSRCGAGRPSSCASAAVAPSNAHRRYEAMRETWALAGLREAHPHVLRYFSCWVQCDVLFIQLEFANGGSLDQLLWRQQSQTAPRALPLHRAMQLLAELASALHFLHSHNMVHLDVKPANTLLHVPGAMQLHPAASLADRVTFLDDVLAEEQRQLVFKLGDLGHVRDRASPAQLEDGEAKYMPLDGLNLEQHKNPAQVDVYSLGLVLVEACGAAVPDAERHPVARAALRRGHLPSLPLLQEASSAGSATASGLCHLVTWMTAPQPEARPSTLNVLEAPVLARCLNVCALRQVAIARARESAQLRSRIAQLEEQLLLRASTRL